MSIIASALVAGILFLPSAAATPTPVATATTTVPAVGDDPSPSQVADATASTTSYTVKLTGYNAVPWQTDADPSLTASGAASNPEVVAARSVDLAQKLPYGTVVKFARTLKDTPNCRYAEVAPQIGYRVIADSMNAKWRDRVDVQLKAANTVPVDGVQRNPAVALGLCTEVTVTVVGHMDLSDIPSTEDELAKLYTPATTTPTALAFNNLFGFIQ